MLINNSERNRLDFLVSYILYIEIFTKEMINHKPVPLVRYDQPFSPTLKFFLNFLVYDLRGGVTMKILYEKKVLLLIYTKNLS